MTTVTSERAHALSVAPRQAAAPAVRERHFRLWRRFMTHHLGVAGGALVLLIALAAIAAPLVAPQNPDQVNLALRTRPPGTAGYILGTDIFGRDLLSRLIWGGRVSLTMGLAAMALSAGVGITLGILAGYWLAPLLTKFAGFPTLISSQSVFIAFSVSAMIGVVFGFFPALKAANLDPIDALRYE